MPRHTLRHAATALLAPALLAPALLGAALLAPGSGAAANDYRPLLVLYDFTAADAGQPMAGLIRDAAGNLYGTESGGNGAVFELSPPPAGAPYKAWKKQTLYTFKGGSDGTDPQGQLLRDSEGNLYGVTYLGGGTGCYLNFGCGTVYELSPPATGQTTWQEKIIKVFSGGSDGAGPDSNLIEDSAGNLYGTTSRIANAPCFSIGCGKVFELSPPSQGNPGWAYNVLYNAPFANEPYSGLVFGPDGSLYGTTDQKAFELSPPAAGQTAWTETDIASFGEYYGSSSLVFDRHGSLYGVTDQNLGARRFVGGVYKLTPPSKGTQWPLSVLATFATSNGKYPSGAPALDADGNFLGVTDDGGHRHGGVVYEMTPDDALVVLHKFDPGRSGVSPYGALTIDPAGNIFGTTSSGGANGKGAIWEIPAAP